MSYKLKENDIVIAANNNNIKHLKGFLMLTVKRQKTIASSFEFEWIQFNSFVRGGIIPDTRKVIFPFIARKLMSL